MVREITAQGQVDYDYDDAGRRTSATVAGRPPIFYTYDNADRLIKIAQGSIAVEFAYDAADRRETVTLPNGVVGSYEFDDADQLLSIAYDRGGTRLGDIGYSYDLSGRRVGQSGSMAKMVAPPSVTSATYDAANRLIAWGSASLSYDANGNLLTYGAATYEWNARGQLVEASDGSSNYQYDTLDRRTSRTVGGIANAYVYDQFDPILVDGTLLIGGLGLDDIYASISSGGAQSSFLTDALGSTRALSDESGNLTAQYSYTPFGAAMQSGSSSTPFQFTGRENDVAANLHYYRARYYRPNINRFISEDPIGLWGGENLYAYVGGDPVSLTDPFGLDEIYRVDGVSFDAYPKGDGKNESARHGPHGEYHFHLNGDSKKVVNAYTFEPENPGALTKKEKAILDRLSERERRYLKKACREVFHNNGQIIGKLKVRYLGRALGIFGAVQSNTYTEHCALDVDNVSEACVDDE